MKKIVVFALVNFIIIEQVWSQDVRRDDKVKKKEKIKSIFFLVVKYFWSGMTKKKTARKKNIFIFKATRNEFIMRIGLSRGEA